MGLYGRISAETHTAAVDAMESCLSAAHVDVAQPYKLRLETHKDAIFEILDMFNRPETQYEHTALMRLTVDMFDGQYFTGFDILQNQRLLDSIRGRIKGKLLFTRSLLADKDKNPGNAKKNFARFKLAEAQDGI